MKIAQRPSAAGGKYTTLLVAALILGALAGIYTHDSVSAAHAATLTTFFNVLSRIFLRLIQMIIAPIVLSTLVTGIARLGSSAAIGRTTVKALLFFLVGSVVSLVIGAAAALLFEPGVGMHLLPAGASVVPTTVQEAGAMDLVERAIPTSLFGALASNAVLQIVVFALFAGPALAQLGSRAQPVIDALDVVTEVMLNIAGRVIRFAPAGVFGATAAAFCSRGIDLVKIYAHFVLEMYGVLGIIAVLLVLQSRIFVGKRTPALLRCTRDAVLIGWSTSSSEVAYPALYSGLRAFGVPSATVGFIIPLGYAFNCIGSMAYCAFGALFVTQAYGLGLSSGRLLLMLAMLLIMSKGIANVPRASLVVIVTVLSYFNIPEAGIALIMGVDQLVDMGRTAVNVLATAVTAGSIAASSDPAAASLVEPVAGGGARIARQG